MTAISGCAGIQPTALYSRVEKSTAPGKGLETDTRVKSTQKSLGFKWKNICLEYQSEEIELPEFPKGLGQAEKFAQAMFEAQQIRELSSPGSERFSPGNSSSKSAIQAYLDHQNMDYSPSRPPMLDRVV